MISQSFWEELVIADGDVTLVLATCNHEHGKGSKNHQNLPLYLGFSLRVNGCRSLGECFFLIPKLISTGGYIYRDWGKWGHGFIMKRSTRDSFLAFQCVISVFLSLFSCQTFIRKSFRDQKRKEKTLNPLIFCGLVGICE